VQPTSSNRGPHYGASAPGNPAVPKTSGRSPQLQPARPRAAVHSPPTGCPASTHSRQQRAKPTADQSTGTKPRGPCHPITTQANLSRSLWSPNVAAPDARVNHTYGPGTRQATSALAAADEARPSPYLATPHPWHYQLQLYPIPACAPHPDSLVPSITHEANNSRAPGVGSPLPGHVPPRSPRCW
jgi:hypothetical protein